MWLPCLRKRKEAGVIEAERSGRKMVEDGVIEKSIGRAKMVL